ncbi:MAG: putative type IIS restriction/modification enzyme [uncultured Campylobacterales bacterium]|uniref:site-specific DNA-methyltransferase (adenine-specific) n=1 Tax=uncultured Campylobacterales bacterium TaxID=352960 RepID=A0A6S6T8J3_9BACT|nr:MAG: putative type IIS restriction/modification enzyme [uncultured Campylobacterales bacterium]
MNHNPIFNKKVLQTYITKQNENLIAIRYNNYQKFLEKIDYIKTLKEEKYQDGFLKDIFEECLGYTLDITNPSNFNLEREKKNENDTKKADGVIYLDDKVTGVIELKAQNTQNLDKIESQAFNYHNSHSNSKYIIISNFNELRFYIDKKTSYERFELFELDYEGFKKLHTILSYESIKDAIPLQIKQKTQNHETQISNEVYKIYSNFRNNLFDNIIINNPNINKSQVLKLTQKLCDRIIFILFAEDTNLLQPYTIDKIIKQYKNDWDNKDLYYFYKIYFQAIDKGNEKLDIKEGYNGGLFAPDIELDSLKIDSEILNELPSRLSSYDFASDVSVNILGHIFENSISELEEIQASIDNQDFDTKKGKRKKDGVFYTPNYITDYIVQNTLGKLCEAKKEELNIEDITPPKNPKKPTQKEQRTKQNLEIYRNYLLNLKVLDPACGSGAFLNQALNFLISEHKSLQKKLVVMEDITAYYEIETSILENNLYGVDINEAAVEIAKLSLWLRTATKDKKLTNLSKKIKVGNSLIDDKSVSDKAFVWEDEFREVFERGGFDVVIGNPPYFNIQTLGAKSIIAESIQNNYPQVWQDKSDIIFYFIAKAIELTKNKVVLIVSNAFLFSDKAKKLRNYILDNINISKIINFEKYMVFEDASVTTAIIELDKKTLTQKTLAYSFKNKNYDIDFISNFINFENNYFELNLKKDDVFALVDKKIGAINDKIDSDYPKLKTTFKIGKGMETAANKQFVFKKYPSQFPKEFIKKRMSGEIIKKYEINSLKEYILYFEDTQSFVDLPLSIQNHLIENKKVLDNRATVRNEGRVWWKYSRPMHKNFYSLDKIWCSYRSKENIFCFDNTNEYIGLTNTTVIFDTNKNLDLRYLLALLNSKTLNFRYKSIGKQTGNGIYEYFENGVGKIPIPKVSQEEQKPFIQLVDTILESKETIKKYNKHIDTLNPVEKIEIKEEIEKLETKIQNSTNEIDTMVYKLYNLNDDEIRIVEETSNAK